MNLTQDLPGLASQINLLTMANEDIPDLLNDLDLSQILEEWQSSNSSVHADNTTDTGGSTFREDSTGRARNWCFTINNPDEQTLSNLHTTLPTSRECRYLVFQLEEGSDLQTPHIQGYIELTKSLRFRAVKALISPRAHLEKRRGTQQQAAEYCKKEEGRLDGPWEYGTPAREPQGTRNDLLAVKEAIDTGRQDAELWEDFFGVMAKYYKAVREYRLVKASPRNFKTEVYVLYGTPGTGKSKWAYDYDENAYWKQRGQWWDGYQGQEVVVIDDFYGWLPFDTLLRLCDRYPLMVETKGGQVIFSSKVIIFTTNQHPREWYKNISNFQAFERRVEHWGLFNDTITFSDNINAYTP